MERGLLEPNTEIDAGTAFRLVRDMPYLRASDRQSETLIREWRGTCSGKHYLLKDLYAEMGIPSRVMACTHVAHIDPESAAPQLRRLLEGTNGRFVDVHNFLILELPGGEMTVDATWPQSTAKYGFPVNESFQLGPGPADRLPADRVLARAGGSRSPGVQTRTAAGTFHAGRARAPRGGHPRAGGRPGSSGLTAR